MCEGGEKGVLRGVFETVCEGCVKLNCNVTCLRGAGCVRVFFVVGM